jgi:hypothetical protein
MRAVISALLVSLVLISLSTPLHVARAADSHFNISSFGTPFAMQGDFEGEYVVFPNRIEIRVTKANIRISEHCPYKGRRLLSGVSFGLATTTEGKKWKIGYRGSEYLLEQIMRPGDVVSLGELYFSIPFDGTIDLSKHWLVIQMNDTALDVPKEEPVAGFAFAHSSRDIFR